MADIQFLLENKLSQAICRAFGDSFAGTDPQVRPANNPKFGEYQANLAMGLAKRLRQKPREIATRIIKHLDDKAMFSEVSLAGPGFINMRIAQTCLEDMATEMALDPRLGTTPPVTPQRIVVDYSSPNVAKEMHVGHLRSTVIGDAIVRILCFQGHHVVRQNHIGDWGTQFGMLIELMRDQRAMEDKEYSVSDLNGLYQQAKKVFDEDADFAARARHRVVCLQTGDAETLTLWRQLVEESERHFQAVYSALGVQLVAEDIRGESFYNDDLPKVIEALDQSGHLQQSEGAAVVYPPKFRDRTGDPMPMIVRKSDGGYLYATTDLAAARYRLKSLAAQRIIYVTDARQNDHFAMLFEMLRETGWADAAVRLDHVAFGAVLNKNRRPFKTRAGGTIRLEHLIEEAVQREEKVIASKNPDFPASERARIARVIGVGALKYADLSNDRIKDYIFDWDRMLALDGNTAPYLINAYVRIYGIFRKCGVTNPTELAQGTIHSNQKAERALILQLLQFPQAILGVAESLEPHRLCNYLYGVASAFHQFFEQCPVRDAVEAVRASRLALCQLTARVLYAGLDLLGIEAVERM